MRARALTLLLLAPLPAAGQATDWREIRKPTLRPFAPAQPTRVVLENGMVVLLLEDHELPVVRGTARIRGGAREAPAEKTGLTGVLGEAWRTGGTETRGGDELDDFLEARAAKVETSAAVDSTLVSFDCLKGDFDSVFGVFAELLMKPAFREDKIALAKNQLFTGIARRNDDPMEIADREARRLGYGKDSPYARVEEFATVSAVTRDDLLAFYRRYVHPENTVLGIAGDFDARRMETTLRRAFSSWPRGEALPRPQLAFHSAAPGVYFVAKDDVNQTSIHMVHLGARKDSPDYYAIEVMNEVFGGGFSGRLFANVRSKKGLAYSVRGGVGTGYDAPGLFQLSLGTKSGTTAAAIDALYEEIDSLKRTPATPEELARAKDSILNSFVFSFDSTAKVLRERMRYEFYGYPPDFLERYRAGIEHVSAEDVGRAAGRYVHREEIALLVVGRAADFDRPLASFGPVTPIDIAIPRMPAGK